MSFHHPLLDFSERLGGGFSPFEFSLFLTVGNWGHNSTKISNKLLVESD